MEPEPLSWAEFERVEMRVGTIVAAELFAEARRPAFKLRLDFGDHGIRKSSAQITDRYRPEELIGRQVVAVTNFPPKQIATLMSECLVLGAVGERQVVTLLAPDANVPNGTRIG
ncbi:tRNA-binding protein [Neolewinella xylanilytica]|uniref:tRNA-binding protein n=1 Tax=Neolewinella xylanilytica TaxID=1514080 RepID=A0A2S6I0K6_9BACT|nr:tRNA-binding protein [Neolewinella xylanilytica]PPK84307.1 tRNA-binding protein [Neolewinella xylanilytica]